MIGVRRLVLVRHGGTGTTRRADFAADEPLNPAGVVAACGLRSLLPGFDEAACSPTARARQTAEAAGWQPIDEPGLRPLDVGRWSGRRLQEIGASDPAGLAGWLSDPAAEPHGGETVAELVERVRGLLADWHDAGAEPVVAVTHAAVIRAAVVVALDATPEAFWRIDAAPGSVTELHTRGDGWALVRSNLTAP